MRVDSGPDGLRLEVVPVAHAPPIAGVVKHSASPTSMGHLEVEAQILSFASAPWGERWRRSVSVQKVKSPFTCHSGINSPLRSRVSKYQANGSGPTRLCHHSSVDGTVSALLFLHSPGRAHTPLIVVPRSMHYDSHHNYKDIAREPSSPTPAFYL